MGRSKREPLKEKNMERKKDEQKKVLKMEVSQQNIFNYCNWLELLQRKINEDF